jgi:hypothetical protein
MGHADKSTESDRWPAQREDSEGFDFLQDCGEEPEVHKFISSANGIE